MQSDNGHPIPLLPRRRWLGPTSVVALGLLGLAGYLLLELLGGGFLDPDRPTREDSQRDLGYQALEHHLAHPAPAEGPEDPPQFLDLIEAASPMTLALPRLKPGLRLLDGKLTKLGPYPAVYTRWRDETGTFSLFQFQAHDFRLPPELDRVLLHPRHPEVSERPSDVVVWTEGERGYVLVADPGVSLQWLL